MRELDLVRVKGKTQPVRIYELLEYHTPLTFPNMDRVVKAFEHGLKHYRERQWQDAADSFDKALKANPNDGPSQVYMRLAAHYASHPPGEEWTVARTLLEK